MSKYKCNDTLYEDIYDFDDLNDESFHTSGSFDNFTISKHGYIECCDPSVNRPRAKDDTSRLSPIEKGVRLPNVVTTKHKNTRRRERSLAELGHMDLKTEQNNHKVLSRLRRDHSSELKDTSRSTSILNTHHQYLVSSINDDDLYKSLMTNVADKSILEASPQVLEYERRNSLNHKDLKFQPAPPTNPKVRTNHLNANRRRAFRANPQLDRDVSCHNPPKQCYKPPLPKPELKIDYERDITEALRVEKELNDFRREFNKQNKSRHIVGTEIHLPPLAVVSPNPSLQRKRSIAVPTATAQCKTVDHVSTWNNDSTKRRKGLKASVRRPQKNSIIDISRLPDKIRKEMKKYFN